MAPREKITFLSSAHPAFDKRVFDKEATALAAAGFDVIHVCAPDAPLPKQSVRGVMIEPVKRRAGKLWRPLTLLKSARVAMRQRPDIIHCNEVDSWFVGVIIAKLIGARCVFDAHEDYHGMVAERSPAFMRPLVSLIFALAVRAAAFLTWRIVLAKSSIRDDYAFCSHKLLTVSNYAPTPTISYPSIERAADGPVKLVHLGLFGRLRGWPQLLAALDKLRDIPLTVAIIGSIHDNSETAFWSEVDRLGLRDRIQVTPWLPYDEAFGQLLQSDIGLVLFQPGPRNHVRALPHKMFDYMTAGNALIVPDFAVEVAEIVRNSGAGLLCDPANPQAVADAIRTLATNPELRKRYGEAGQHAVQTVYNWENEAAKLVAMYNGAIEGRGKRHAVAA